LGHIYIHKRIVGILFILSFSMVRVIAQTNYYVLFIVLVLPGIASVHAYGLWQLHKVKPKHLLPLFVIVLLCTGLLKRFLIPMVVDQFFVQPYVPTVGPSMEPTIPYGSRIVVDKFTYIWKEPEIGDIVEFTPPANVSSDHTNSRCKRIVAVGGETIQVRDGDIYVDGKEREERRRTHRQVYYGSSDPINFRGRDNPFLAYGVHEPYHVPEGHYFALGDNQPYSVDSRCFGAIPRKNITGKVIKISWPPRHIGIIR